MHTLQSITPSTLLRPYIRAFAQRDFNELDHTLIQPVPASLEHVLEFDFLQPPQIDYVDGASVSAFQISLTGPHTWPRAQIRLCGKVQSFGIFFEPFGLWQLFRIPNRELTDLSYDASDLLGSDARRLWQALGECRSFLERVALVESYLCACAARAVGQDSMMKAASDLFHWRGVLRIQQMASEAGLSLRQFERRFAESVGIAPKLFGRITRFQMALDYKLSSPSRTWISIAHDFGYHDQMHMVRDFHRLGGYSPSNMLSELGDMRPPALAASDGRLF